LKVKNYRALRDLTFNHLTPLTVFLGPNGCGKSTIFDVFAFLSECFSIGLRKALDKRGRLKELRTRGSKGAVEIEIKYRERKGTPLITYHLTIDEDTKGSPIVAEEWLSWRRKSKGRPLKFLDFRKGEGEVITGEKPEKEDNKISEKLTSPDVLAVNALGQLASNPRVHALRNFITSWHLSYLTADHTRSIPEAGPQEHLSSTGDNLPNVIQYLSEQFPAILTEIQNRLVKRVPRLEKFETEFLQDGRLLLKFKDAPFKTPILAKYASDGTLKMLAYLTLLFDPEPFKLIGIEEPENQLYPQFLYGLAEECRSASEKSQILVTTHSPEFVNGLKPNELWILNRDKKGYTQAMNSAKVEGIQEFVEEGALLGYLWMEGHFQNLK
ncbi:MAG: AAA family ATPase, partial [bacterium]|nr:AAA family ATPase [bacterium]